MTPERFKYHASLTLTRRDYRGEQNETSTYLLQGTPEQIAERVHGSVLRSLDDSNIARIELTPISPINVVDLDGERLA